MRSFLLSIFLLVGCSSYDRQVMTEFEPVGPDRFRYASQYGTFYAADSPGAEAERLDWLATWLQNNAMCSGGHEVTSRRQVAASSLAGRIIYEGRCL